MTTLSVVIKMAVGMLAIFLMLAEVSDSTKEHAPSTFRAAVYAHIPYFPARDITSRAAALEMMRKNLNVYEIQAKKSKQQGAQIIVFPEDGLYGFSFSRKSIQPFLEEIPEPEYLQWTPCTDPGRFPRTEVLQSLSCMAQANGIYVVANMGDYVPCTSTDPKCPPDKHYQYNTDVAFGPDGRLLAKYHKTHLFFETQFNTPEPKVVFFDTPFGRVGMLVCFDLLFKEPAVTGVTENNITIVAFPTAWIDALPLLTAIGFHSSFARGLGVNLLAANIHYPLHGFVGSGIYTPKGMSSFYYNNTVGSPGKLLVSTIDVVHSKPKSDDNGKLPAFPAEGRNATPFNSFVFGDMFTFELLDGASGELNVCQKNICCSLVYNLTENRPSQDLLAFGAFDGLHTLEGQYYFQICTLVKCTKTDDKSSCGSPTKISTTKFKSISISGNFQTKFIYPQVILSNSGQLALADQRSWSFQDNTLKGQGFNHPVLSATLFGRFYSRD